MARPFPQEQPVERFTAHPDISKAKPQHVGIHALEMYNPNHAVAAMQLQQAHHAQQKYTHGLLMDSFCGPDDDEDVVSFALTALSRLMWRNNLGWDNIGMVQVGSESLIDRRKTIKSNLMALFQAHGVNDVAGSDTFNACYGGTAALLNCTNWIQSRSWDGRWAIAIATDIADAPKQHRFMVGAAAVAMLIGPDAPFILSRERVSHMLNRWDFYKPANWHEMAPVVDAPYSIEVYFSCLDSTQRQFGEKLGCANVIEEHDYLVYHLGSGPKFVKHAFERSCALAYPPPESARALEREHQEGEYAEPRIGTARRKCTELSQVQQDQLFESKVAPSLCLATRIGPMHTAALYVNLISLLLEKRESLVGSKILMFSFGSGAASTMYRLFVKSLPVTNWDKHEELDSRLHHSAEDFDALCARYSATYGRVDWKPTNLWPQAPGAYYLNHCDASGRRAYHLIECDSMDLQVPRYIGIESIDNEEG